MAARIVADADGLIKLGKSGALERLLSAAEVLVPEPVYEEAVVAGKRGLHEDALELEQALRGAVEVVPEPSAEERDKRAEALLADASSLGVGERAALRLFFARRAEAVLTDDRAFAKVLAREGLTVLLPTAAIVSLAENGRMGTGEAVGALRKIEGLVRRDVYEAATEDVERMSGKEGER
jgi:predicted nucleic acid-binding protein